MNVMSLVVKLGGDEKEMFKEKELGRMTWDGCHGDLSGASEVSRSFDC